jgi:hypothetical protein
MHNELVEAFAALRDYEKDCFSRTSSLRAPVEWHRAFRDLESRWEVWIKRFRCGHDPASLHRSPPRPQPSELWTEWIAEDARRRDTPPSNSETKGFTDD